MLVPAKGFARQERIAEPLERDEGVAAAFGFSQRGAQFFDACIHVGRKRGLGLIFVGGLMIRVSAMGRADRTRGRLVAFDALEVDADLVVLRRPGIGECVAALAAAVFAAQLHDGLIARRREKAQGANHARILCVRQIV